MARKSQAKKIVTPEIDKLESARQQGQAQFDSIKEMVEALQHFEEDDAKPIKACGYELRDREGAEQMIHEDALSVQVRSGWYTPGADSKDIMRQPCEYEILLCTGGPACRIVGKLSDHNEPETAVMEVQDWFTPWTAIRPMVAPENYDSEPVMLAYARCFYFEEG